MALVYVPERRIRRDFKPDFPVELNLNSRHLRGVSDVVLPELRKTLLRRYDCTVQAGVVNNIVGSPGRGIDLDGASLNGLVVGTADKLFDNLADGVTIFLVRRSKDTTARNSTIFGYNEGETSRILVHGPWSDGSMYWDCGASGVDNRISLPFAKTTNVEKLVFVGNGGKGREIWRDGVRIAKSAQAGAIPAATQTFKLGTAGVVADAYEYSDLEEHYLLGIVKRAWTDDEIIEWSANPYKTILKPRQRRIWVGITSGSFTYTPSGGISFAGSADLNKGKIAAVSGGITFAGSGGVSKDKAFPVSGGIVFSGAAEILKTKAFQPSGSIVFGGSAATSFASNGNFVYTPTGGISFGGSGVYSRSKVFQPSGALALSGSAAVLKTKVVSGGGSITFAGSAAISTNTLSTWTLVSTASSTWTIQPPTTTTWS